MIKGIGVDIIEIHRIQKAIKRQGFLERVFTPQEIHIFRERNFNPATIAGFFAAKEATAKALGTGIRNMKWKDIEIQHNHLGTPYVTLHNEALSIACSQNIREIFISVSHSKENAIAQVLAL